MLVLNSYGSNSRSNYILPCGLSSRRIFLPPQIEMGIRRMKSLSGIRRLWSDYGYEGILREENLWKIARVLAFSTSAVTTMFSLSVVALRTRDQTVFDTIKADMSDLCAAPAPPHLAHSFISLVREELEKKKISIADLRRAAAHLRTVEVDLVQLYYVVESLARGNEKEEAFVALATPSLRSISEAAWSECKSVSAFREKVATNLVEEWIKRGVFNFDRIPNKSVFGNRETSEAIGVDIGCRIGSVLSSDGHNVQCLDAQQLHPAVRLVEQWGFALIKNAIPSEYVTSLCEKWKLNQGTATENGERVKSLDANISHSRAMVNRLNMIVRGSKLEEDTQRIHSAIFPIVSSLHERAGKDDKPLMMSDIRIVVVDEAAERTNWTIYNPRGGFTVMIPLHDRDYRMGSQEMIGGSHFLINKSINIFRRLSWASSRAYMVPFPVRVTDFTPDGCWRAGDALVLDNRTLVRGEENTSFKSGTYLLAKYEPVDAAAGGLFLSGKILFRLAQAWETVSRWSHPRN